MLVKLVFNTTKISLIINGVQSVRMLKICSLCLPEIVVADFSLLRNSLFWWCYFHSLCAVPSVCCERKRPMCRLCRMCTLRAYILRLRFICICCANVVAFQMKIDKHSIFAFVCVHQVSKCKCIVILLRVLAETTFVRIYLALKIYEMSMD